MYDYLRYFSIINITADFSDKEMDILKLLAPIIDSKTIAS